MCVLPEGTDRNINTLTFTTYRLKQPLCQGADTGKIHSRNIKFYTSFKISCCGGPGSCNLFCKIVYCFIYSLKQNCYNFIWFIQVNFIIQYKCLSVFPLDEHCHIVGLPFIPDRFGRTQFSNSEFLLYLPCCIK